MGVKRTVVSGRKDALGRTIKVSADTGRAATAPPPPHDDDGERRRVEIAETMFVSLFGRTRTPVADPADVPRENDMAPVVNAVPGDDPTVVAEHVSAMYGVDWWEQNHATTGLRPAERAAWQQQNPCPERLYFAQDCATDEAAVAGVRAIGTYNDFDGGRVAERLQTFLERRPGCRVTIVRRLTPGLRIEVPAGSVDADTVDEIEQFHVAFSDPVTVHTDPDGAVHADIYWSM